MKSITVYPQDITPNALYMCDAEGRCDLLGQLLMNGFGIRIPPRTRTPQCLSSAINHFVVCIRRYVYCNTPLTLQLLALSPLPPRKQVEEANKLLQAIGIVLVTEEQQTTIRNNIEQPETVTVEPELFVTNLFRTSRYKCSCGQSQSLTSLIYDTDDNDSVMAYCNYCSGEVPDELCLRIYQRFAIEVRHKLATT
jgi:hypothetical protein